MRARRSQTSTRARRPVRIGIVAGEASGDLLGAGLIEALKRRLPGARFEGIGGPLMQAQGCRSLFPMEALTLIGLGNIGKLVSIFRIRQQLAKRFLADPPDLFIGVDVPDFNLGLEARLKAAGIATAHYVSPTVWAWRGYRIHGIRKAVDLMLTLFPFEERYYREHDVRVVCVGHPLADAIPLRFSPRRFRDTLGLPRSGTIIAMLPGSRRSELERHAGLFVRTAILLAQRYPRVHFVAPFVSRETRAIFESAMREAGTALPITLLDGHSRDAMAAADLVFLASGTATLEAALLRKPMVVTYRLPWLTYWLVRMFSHVRAYSLPNNLAGREVVPELLQREATPKRASSAISALLGDRARLREEQAVFGKIHRTLRRGANEQAADAVLGLLAQQKRKRQA